MTGTTTAAILQMTSGIDPEANAAAIVEAVGKAAADGAAMLFTPEMSNLLDRDRDRAAGSIRREEDDPVLAAVRDAARAHAIWVHLGSLAVLRDDGRHANRAFVIDATGAVRARYDKLHLFDVDLPNGESWRESSSYTAGDRAVVVDTPVGTLGLSICYDLRFPGLYCALADAGATVLAVPAAFTRPTGEHWHALLRARAIENTAYVVAAAQTGEHPDGRATHGHSLVIDPWGDTVEDSGVEPALRLFPIDRAKVDGVRSRLPDHKQRRPLPPVEAIA